MKKLYGVSYGIAISVLISVGLGEIDVPIFGDFRTMLCLSLFSLLGCMIALVGLFTQKLGNCGMDKTRVSFLTVSFFLNSCFVYLTIDRFFRWMP